MTRPTVVPAGYDLSGPREPVNCPLCKLPIGYIQGAGPYFVQYQDHHGQKHAVVWTAEKLRELAAGLEHVVQEEQRLLHGTGAGEPRGLLSGEDLAEKVER